MDNYRFEKRFTCLVLASLLTVAACGPAKDKTPAQSAVSPPAWTDASPHQVKFVQVNGIRLNYLDWGGTGDGLILIHGLGDSPHSFDDIAPQFRDHYRVVAYARRGHGQTEGVAPYDNATLVEDLRQLLDSLGIKRASLAGWSMGGNEITGFAERYPQRVDRLVYLEAAYDWSDTAFQRAIATYPIPIQSDSASMASLGAFRASYKTSGWPDVDWTPAMEAEVRDIAHVQPDGRVRVVPTDSQMTVLFASLSGYHRNYRVVKAPALAFYVQYMVSPVRTDSAVARRVKAWNDSIFDPFRVKSRERFAREMHGSREVFLPNTSHSSFFFQARDTVVAEMRRFLIVSAGR